MARLLQVSLDANDATGAANTAAIKAALTGIGSHDGIQLPPGTFRVYATSGSVAPVPVGKGIYGAPVAPGAEPTTRLLLVGSDSTTANVVTEGSNGLAQGILVQDLYVDGGRAGGWATASHAGRCISLAGQNDYASPHNILIANCRLVDGLTSQTAINSINTGVIRNVNASATTSPVQAAHGMDFDAVANNKRSKFITISDCDFDAYGQESMKLENCSDFTISRTTFRMYVSLTQDVSPYDELGRITFDQCTFLAHVGLTRIKLTLGGGTGGDGTVTWNRCTFGDAGMIKSEDATVANYGTQTITYCTFSRFGNSFKFPAGVTYVSTGNLFAEMPTKRFARASYRDKYATAPLDAGAGPNAYMARETCITNIQAAVTASANGEEVWVLNGTYPGATSGNRSINCGGKTITLRAESMFGVVLDLSAGSGYAGFTQTADVAGHLIWGFVCYGAGLGGGNGAGATITGGDSYMRAMAFINGKTGNSGAGYRNTSTGTSVLEDFVIAGSDLQTSHGALYVSQAAPVGTVTISRGRVLRSTANNANGGAVRIDNANTTVNGLEVAGNVNTGGSGGCAFTKACTVTNLTCAGNTGSATSHDVNVSAAVTGDSWVCWSDDATATKSVNVASSTLTLDKATIFGGSGAVTGAGTKTLTNIISTDPLFTDAVGGNYQLKDNSPARGVGVQRAGMADGFNRPFAYNAASANHGAWA